MKKIEQSICHQAAFHLLVGCALLVAAGLISSPWLGAKVSAETAEARPAPDKPLTREALEALVENLKGSLAEVIDDEDIQNSITEKWDNRMAQLVGKTGKEVVRLFLEDVKSVIEDDQETINALTESFTKTINLSESTPAPADTPEPTPVSPPTPKPTVWIKIVHNGAYIGHFEVSWDEPGKPNNSWKQESKTAGWQDTITLPGDATNIRLIMQRETGLVWDPRPTFFSRVMQQSDLNKCYRVSGTTLDARYDNNCQ